MVSKGLSYRHAGPNGPGLLPDLSTPGLFGKTKLVPDSHLNLLSIGAYDRITGVSPIARAFSGAVELVSQPDAPRARLDTKGLDWRDWSRRGGDPAVPGFFQPAFQRMELWADRTLQTLQYSLAYYFSNSDSRIAQFNVPALTSISDDWEASVKLAETAQWLRRHTKSTEPLVIFPDSPLLYFLSERPDPYFYSIHSTPGFLSASPLASLKTTEIDWIVLAEDSGTPAVDRFSRETLAQWLKSFRLVNRLGDYRIYRRKR